MSRSSASKLRTATAFVLLSGLAGTAMSTETTWEKHHPRRDQVNDRLENQDKRINHEVKQGDLTQKQAAALHKDDHMIRQEERDMAQLDHGHITAADQKALDQQENVVSRQIAKPATAKPVATSTETKWEKQHPRRDQVNDRLENQNKRIKQEVKEGDLSQTQAAALHKDDHMIRQEERDMAKLDQGHITAADQKALDQQENVVSKQIGQ